MSQSRKHTKLVPGLQYPEPELLVSVVGPRVRLELRTDNSDQIVHAELPRHQFSRLGLVQGGSAWIRPVNCRVFLNDSEVRGDPC